MRKKFTKDIDTVNTARVTREVPNVMNREVNVRIEKYAFRLQL